VGNLSDEIAKRFDGLQSFRGDSLEPGDSRFERAHVFRGRARVAAVTALPPVIRRATDMIAPARAGNVELAMFNGEDRRLHLLR
jgi:hypothetical protein